MSHPTRRSPGQALSVLTAVCILAGASAARAVSAARSVAATSPASERLTGEQASRLLRQIAAELGPLAAASRQVLLGARKPDGPSCVRLVKASDLKAIIRRFPHTAGGGPGTAFPVFTSPGERSSVKADFLWQQTRLRTWLDQMRGRNRDVSRRAERLWQAAGRFAVGARAWTRWPQGLVPARAARSAHWPGACLRSLNEAAAAKNLDACRRWADELASAAFALADLHRWLEFLLANHLDSLAYQARCRDLFAWADSVFRAQGAKYVPNACYPSFPASALALAMTENLLEVERQAERLFHVPERFAANGAGRPLAAPAAVWMPPDLRKDFVFLRSCLSPANQRLWDQAAAMPFERSYLANVVFRMSSARALDSLGVVLRRFDKANPRAETADLMDVVFYRGEIGGGLAWGDRFDPRLLRAAGHMAGPGQAVLLRAHALTQTVLGNWSNYDGTLRTLTQVLDEGKMDCICGTDMIGSLYRNSGRSGYHPVHLSCGVASHTLGAAATRTDGVRAMFLADSLARQSGRDVWPSAYFQGHLWPKGYPGPRGPAFSAELYARGLDNYVFAEGYIVRGRHAGKLVCAAIPYLPGRQKADARIIYGGPYPPIPAVPRPAATSPGR